MIDPHRSGRQVFTSCRADGRRTDAPYRDYADFMRATREIDAARQARSEVRRRARSKVALDARAETRSESEVEMFPSEPPNGGR